MHTAPSSTSAHPVTVLLLEDHQADASLIQEYLRASPAAEFKVEHVLRVAEAEAALQRAMPDVVLCDLVLPDGRGVSVVRRLRELAPLLPLIVVTGSLPAEGHEALSAGASAFLVKGELGSQSLGETVLLTHLRQQALRRALDVVEQCSDGFLVKDADGRVRYVNPAAESLLQVEGRDLRGKDAPLLEPGTTTEVLRPDGTLAYVRAARATTQWEGRPAELLTLRDVTEQVERDARARTAERLEAIGRLAGSVAHDFNNMLTVIVGNARSLTGEFAASDPRRRSLETILDASDRAAGLVSSLLTFAGRRELRPQVVGLNAALRSLQGLLLSSLGHQVELQFDPAADELHVHVDPGQFAQAVVNLASNANHAMPEGGTLTLALSGEGEWAQLRVSDTGVGMPPEVRERIFEPFFSTRAHGEGTGLGLASVRGFVAQSDGRIHCTSQVGVGTTFVLELPRVPAPAPQSAATEEAEDPVDGGGARLLLVDDEALVARILRDTLVKAGFHVDVAASGDEALALLENGAAPQLLITDLSMRGMSGTELAHAARERLPELQVAFMSGYAASELDPESPWQSCPFLQKPFTPRALAEFVAQVLSG